MNNVTKKSDRSVAYPSTDLENAVKLIQQLNQSLGKGPYSRGDAARGMGYAGLSGASARAVAALVHYDLLDRSGNTYSLSELAKRILHPIDESGNETKQALVMAGSAPKLFAKLISRFEGQALPSLLNNILINEGINPKAANEVANIFKKSLEYAGILQNGVITSLDEVATAEESQSQQKIQRADTPVANKKNVDPSSYSFSDSGFGWQFELHSKNPLNSNIRKALVDLTDLLEQNNKGSTAGD